MPFEICPFAVQSQALTALHVSENVKAFLALPPGLQRARIDSWSLLKVLGLALYSGYGCTVAEEALSRWWTSTLSAIGDPAEIRRVMRDTGAVLSGSRAVRFLDRESSFDCSDWDFYTTEAGYDTFCSFVREQLGGVEVSRVVGARPSRPFDGTSATANSTELKERRKFVTPNGSMDVMCSKTASALSPLTVFHSTVVMNYLTADGFCLAYPMPFFKRFNIRGHDADDRCVAKYRRRGFTVAEPELLFAAGSTEHACLPWGLCTRHVRAFGDRYCLAFTFEKQGRPITHLCAFPRPLPTCMQEARGDDTATEEGLTVDDFPACVQFIPASLPWLD
ncbi:hypothetical protein PsYK624_170580 [Phanerochaete sordida]|uniref:Uncharacterized protein n=1 Tax=Phanerochaete sordida TaxID=48140 RepID=A0A9P3GTF1_9APHY|nr:hypothetical protein PsYK624_170580 [Phanerochaete sordida]